MKGWHGRVASGGGRVRAPALVGERRRSGAGRPGGVQVGTRWVGAGRLIAGHRVGRARRGGVMGELGSVPTGRPGARPRRTCVQLGQLPPQLLRGAPYVAGNRVELRVTALAGNRLGRHAAGRATCAALEATLPLPWPVARSGATKRAGTRIKVTDFRCGAVRGHGGKHGFGSTRSRLWCGSHTAIRSQRGSWHDPRRNQRCAAAALRLDRSRRRQTC